ncbi:peptidase M1 [Chryseobacterium angstadtii]|uniref:Aminopeptidase N n=1 Tax=Chryseobacterium angstadtii TaxID=558151 RepID=A0A0J7I2B2_9FLAO|nr:M1 family aminopeptidase [Chryseobacterium angstadtii]KMQ59961.1 peptidase M1 [Chryseobacterium angstadtii]
MCKKIIFLLTALTSQLALSQTDNLHREQMKAKEMKSFAGKMGAGNINPNTLNYDLQYQRMELTLNPEVNQISGSVTSHFKPSQSISSIYFDFKSSLNVSQVQYHGTDLTFQQLPSREIKIDFPALLQQDIVDSLTIRYSGSPNSFSFSTGNQSGSPTLYTFNQPYGAQDWFPTKQSLNDKIDRMDFKITTPSQYSVAANGKLMSETNLANGQKLTFWRTMYPTAAYLVALSIANFTKYTDTIGNPPFPFVNYVYTATAGNTSSLSDIEWTKQIMTTFENYFGPYPFRNEKYGHMEFGFNWAGLEHQTISSMGAWDKSLIAHELAHQWFGDKVTCGTWNDIWLNEGFATFGEHLANEKLLMNNAQFISYMNGQKNIATASPGGSVYVSDANLGNVSVIFDSRLSYTKAGYLVWMMKWILGDDVFYQALKDYHARPNLAYNYAATSDLKASFLQSTGKDFTEFFNDWLYGQGQPTYTIKWKQAGNQIQFKVAQSQSHSSVSFFEMPLPVKVNGTGGQTAYFALNNTFNNQEFTEAVTFPVASVEFNYERQILERNSTVAQDNTLKVSSVEKEKDIFTLYPNPVKNELYLKGIEETAPYSIHSADGMLLKKGVYQPGKAIVIADLLSGTYIFTVKEQSLKFIKH